MTISAYSELFHLENYVRVVVNEFELQRVSSHDVTHFLHHSISAKLLSLYIYKRVLFKSQNLATMMTNHCQSYMCCDAQIHEKSQRLSLLSIEAIIDLD